ncbi:MAG TPA: extracellular solute-binding protein [Burkholderiales bacterium]|nr:extracellular solute-binding protein [Burkholderiales bacterium]
MRAFLALVCIAVAASAQAQTRIEQAKREGDLVWYTSMNVADVEAVLKPFRERYPFLYLSILRAPGSGVRSSILSEARDGRYRWDVVSANLGDVHRLARAGLLAPYASPQTASGFPPGTVDPEGHWAAIYLRHYVIAYNRALVKPEEAPKSWQALLDPHWAGKLGLDEDDAEWYAGMLEYWGHDRTVAYMRALARQRPQFRGSHQVLTDQLAAGELALALVYANEIDSARRAGAPVEWLHSFDPIIASPSPIAISVRAPHPAAARLLVDYLLSPEGQRVIRSRFRAPARSDVGGAPPAALKLHALKPRVAVDYFDEREAEFRRLLAPR